MLRRGANIDNNLFRSKYFTLEKNADDKSFSYEFKKDM